MKDQEQDTGKQNTRQENDVSEEAMKAIRFYRKISKAVAQGKNVEVKKDKDGKLKLLQVSKEII